MKYLFILILLFLTSCAYLQCVDMARTTSQRMLADAEEINALEHLYDIEILDYGCENNTPWIRYEMNGHCRKTELMWYKYWYENKTITIVPDGG